tara:strand:+ start:491 stop:637 length:147 start_codon:yes stop_codon:yes gene_type:complete
MKGTNLAIIFVLIFSLFGARLILKAHKYAEEIKQEREERMFNYYNKDF